MANESDAQRKAGSRGADLGRLLGEIVKDTEGAAAFEGVLEVYGPVLGAQQPKREEWVPKVRLRGNMLVTRNTLGGSEPVKYSATLEDSSGAVQFRADLPVDLRIESYDPAHPTKVRPTLVIPICAGEFGPAAEARFYAETE